MRRLAAAALCLAFLALAGGATGHRWNRSQDNAIGQTEAGAVCPTDRVGTETLCGVGATRRCDVLEPTSIEPRLYRLAVDCLNEISCCIGLLSDCLDKFGAAVEHASTIIGGIRRGQCRLAD